MVQISIRLDDDLHAWVNERIKNSNWPETSINKYIIWLIEQDMIETSGKTYKQKENAEWVEYKRPYNITSDGQIEG